MIGTPTPAGLHNAALHKLAWQTVYEDAARAAHLKLYLRSINRAYAFHYWLPGGPCATHLARTTTAYRGLFSLGHIEVVVKRIDYTHPLGEWHADRATWEDDVHF